MCFTLFGLTITIARSVVTNPAIPWYPGAERSQPDRILESSRLQGDLIWNLVK